MRFFSTIGVLFYTLVLSMLGGLIIGFTLHLVKLDQVVTLLNAAYVDINLRIVVGLTGLLLIFISTSFAQLILGRFQKERTIAFSNPSGQVSVSLTAVEDLVQRLVSHLPEVKEIRPDVVVNKKGIHVDLRLILRSEVNIPDFTLRLQEMIKGRVQDILGVEEEVNVRIHISKIISKKEEKIKGEEESSSSDLEHPTIPFKGYGRV